MRRFGDRLAEHRPLSCKFDGRNIRTFVQPAAIKENRALSLDFVFSNRASSDAVFTSVDLEVTAAENVAGGSPGIVVPNHVYEIALKHKVGTQSFPLKPVYRIPGNDTGAFSIAFEPAAQGVGMCWILRAVFHTSLGVIKSDRFSFILSKFDQQ